MQLPKNASMQLFDTKKSDIWNSLSNTLKENVLYTLFVSTTVKTNSYNLFILKFILLPIKLKTIL
jgi:hypothetical protein